MRTSVNENSLLMTVDALRALGRDVRGTPNEGSRDDTL